MTNTDTVYPTVNLNGSDGKQLLAQYREIYEMFAPLMEAMAKARPHGRDYQTMPGGSYEKARFQYVQAEVKVQEAKEFIENLALNVLEQTNN